ncbi:MAG: ATP-binding cassette domain-containing protein, partial [Myxococcales bacterium]|nr:ATP-binding cassette domain-containing protein [Myxococcales bacterium]
MTVWSASVSLNLGDFELDLSLSGGAAPLALVGPNGSGKSSFLRVLAGAITPHRAEIQFGKATVHSTKTGVSIPVEQRRIGYVPQGYGLFPHLGVLDNVAFGLSVGSTRASKADRRRRAKDMLDALDSGHLVNRRVDNLSGGEQQRVALARALVIQPRALLLDEPLAALDVTTRRSVRTFLASHLKACGIPSIVVTHDVRDVDSLDAEVCVIERGHLVQRGDLAW